MEDLLCQLIKDSTGNKHTAVKKAAQDALEVLRNDDVCASAEAYQLRDRVLAAFQLGIESKNLRLAQYSVSGMQKLLSDDRFQSSMECEEEERWLPIQILKAVSSTPTLPEEIQVDVMKLLLNMAFTTAWCMNAQVITKICELLLDLLHATSKQSLRNSVINAIFRILEVVFHRHENSIPTITLNDCELVAAAYSSSPWGSVRTAVRATLTQLLTAIVTKLRELDAKDAKITSAIEEFTNNGGKASESLSKDVVTILKYLCEKLYATQHPTQNHQVEPLMLEGIYAVLSNLPVSVRSNQDFIDLIWQQLCPTLISILGNPMTDKSVMSQKGAGGMEDVGRGSGCSTNAPNVHSMSAKTIYSIAVELVRLVGCYQTLRPVLESVFHRMLLYPPPVHRHEALKAIKELLSNPDRLLDLCGPTIPEPAAKPAPPTPGRKKAESSELSLLKLIMDSIQDCCHCNDSSVCITTVGLVNDLLTSVEELVKGHGLSMDQVKAILEQYDIEGTRRRFARCLSPNPVDSQNAKNLQVPGQIDPDGTSSAYSDSDSEGEGPDKVGSDVTSSNEVETMSESDKESPVHHAQKKLYDPADIRDVYMNRSASRTMEFEAAERKCAQEYVAHLLMFLSPVLKSTSALDVDLLLQKFASDVCTSISEKTESHTEGAILNADGVYLATYNALLLNLKLLRNGYYESEEKSLCMAEQQFIDDILSTDLLVYLSRSWLAEVFQQVIQKDLLSAAGYKDSPLAYTECALIELLTDMDGLGSRKIGGQLLCAFRDLEAVSNGEPVDVTGQPLAEVDKMAMDAGMKFARQVLSVSWESILDVLSVLLDGKSSCGISGSLAFMFNAKEESRKGQEAICTSLEGLQKAARLSCVLGLQDRCGAVFAQLSNASCVVELEDIKRDREQRPQDKKPAIPAVLQSKPKLAKLHAAHALSMDVVLSIGLEMGSHSSDCWKHVFRCCAHISELEHTYFSQGQNQSLLPKVQQESQPRDHASDDIDFDNPEMYSSMMVPSEPVAPTIDVKQIIKQSSVEAGWDKAFSGGGVLTSPQASKALCGLSQEVDRLYEDAANKLNMRALVHFLSELCKASHHQLSTHGKSHGGQGDTAHTAPGSLPTTALHLYRLGDIMLKCLTSGRPLLHIMRAWSVVAPHFVEAACHKDSSISKKAVHCIHEVVTSLLGNQPELPHFHFNESLCKPFENLLCLELCDGDVQDQIVCSICELVEACTNDIKSGWRPLFGALRAVKIEYTTSEEINEARQRHVAAVLDVFEVFLNTDNVLVFAHAAVDCIMCLLKYVRGPGDFEEIYAEYEDIQLDTTPSNTGRHIHVHEGPMPEGPVLGEFEDCDDDSDSGSDMPETVASDNLILPALGYLQKCCNILASMWQMPACPVFNGAHRIKVDSLRSVDPVIPNMNLTAFQKPFLDSHPSSTTSHPISNLSLVHEETMSMTLNNPDGKLDDKTADSKSLNSIDSGIGPLNNTDPGSASPEKEDKKSHDIPKAAGSGSHDTPKPAGSRSPRMNPFNKPEQVNLAPAGIREVGGSEVLLTYEVRSLEQIDNHSGVLHVYFLVLEGLVSTVSACPKNYQPQTLEMLFELMRTSAKVPGPTFALNSVNHLLLPMLQSWLRRGNQLTGYWDSATVANFKQCSGLCTDLVVEFIIQFANLPEQQPSVECLLKQLLDVLTECIAQPIEALSRLGCACIRHSLLSCGPMLTERMWQISAMSLRHAFDISLYSLRQLMTPFHTNSDNFYGDIGQVKVAVRKDCSGIECERLRLLAQQVFLLDSQRTASSVVDYEAEEDRSYIFLIYPPEDRAMSDDLVTRVPFRRLVVGLLAHQILVQTVGCLLIRGSSNMVPSERSMMPSSPGAATRGSIEQEEEVDALMHDTHMPGMMRYLSCRNMCTLLQCLLDSYQAASNFDQRPGLKFLIQKVARAEVGANMYKQAGVSLTFYIHALMEICAHQDNIGVENTKTVLRKELERAPDQENNSQPTTELEIFYKEAEHFTGAIQNYIIVFVCKMKSIFDEVCTNYVDMYLDKEGPNMADRLSGQMLVFLLAQPEELPTLKRDKSLKELVAEKLKKRNAGKDGQTESQGGDGSEQEQSLTMGIMPLQPVAVQGENTDNAPEVTTSNTTPQTSPDHIPKSSEDDRVYTVATDKTIKSLMSEYKKRKSANSMPTFVKASRSKPAPPRKERSGNNDPVENEIEQQQKASIMKDSEAHLSSWIEMICNVLQLFHQLPDYQYKALLPIIFNCVNQLICHCKDARLRDVLAQWTYRIGHLYGFAPVGDLPPK